MFRDIMEFTGGIAPEDPNNFMFFIQDVVGVAFGMQDSKSYIEISFRGGATQRITFYSYTYVDTSGIARNIMSEAESQIRLRNPEWFV